MIRKYKLVEPLEQGDCSTISIMVAIYLYCAQLRFLTGTHEGKRGRPPKPAGLQPTRRDGGQVARATTRKVLLEAERLEDCGACLSNTTSAPLLWPSGLSLQAVRQRTQRRTNDDERTRGPGDLKATSRQHTKEGLKATVPKTGQA